MNGFTAQALAAIIANLLMVSGGMMFGWSSPSLPHLLADDSDIPLTSSQGAWVASFLSLGSILGPALSALIVDRIGRKWALELMAVPMVVSWALMAMAPSYEWLCASRFIGGVGLGATYAVLPMYVGEIAEDRIRGGLGVLMMTLGSLGLLLAFSIGPWVSRQMLALIGTIPPVLLMIALFWLPDTPHYLLMKGDREAAHLSLSWFRRKNDVKEELDKMEIMISEDQSNKTSILEVVKNPGNRKAFLIVAGLLFTQQFSGVLAVEAYSSSIFNQSGFSISSSVSVVITGVVALVSVLCALPIVDTYGRRPVLIFSVIGTFLVLTVEAVFYQLQHYGCDVSGIAWLPLVGIIGYFITCNVGLLSLPYVILGELFPTNVKASATMMLTMFGAACGMVVTKLFQVVEDALAMYVVFYIFALCCVIGFFFIFFCVPETKGRSLQEIQARLNNRTVSEETIIKESIQTYQPDKYNNINKFF